MDEFESESVVTVGQSLREAREAKGMSIEDIAAQTRIPTRHLSSLEESDWTKLPAATYTIGFAKNYAGAVGLDRTEIGDRLRAEMGGAGPVTVSTEVYEAADPARSMPKGLVLGALAMLALVVLALAWLNNRSLQSDEAAPTVSEMAEPGNVAAPVAAPASQGPVVLTANEAVWIEVKDGNAILKQGELAAGQSYEVPAGALAPVLTTGKPEALRISIGTADAPAVGPAGQRVSQVSLKAADLLRGPASAPQSAAAPSPPAQTAPTSARPPARRPRPAPPPVVAPSPAPPPPTETNSTPPPPGQ
ncbi:MAG TPA: RodZ domain-containing protein [Sphingomicrobium sp.]|nr:RodZ domain-containing protein [Sphingomicrobium sp.]